MPGAVGPVVGAGGVPAGPPVVALGVAGVGVRDPGGVLVLDPGGVAGV